MAEAKAPDFHFTLSMDPCDAEGTLIADRSCAPERFGLVTFVKAVVNTSKGMNVELGRRWDDGIETGDLVFTVPRRGGYYRFVLRDDQDQVVGFGSDPTWYAERAFLGHGDPIRVAIPRQD